MNKKSIIIFVFVLIIGVASVMVYQTATKLIHQQHTAQQLSHLPELPVQEVGTAATNGWRTNQKPTLIVFFNSECGHCQYEATAIQEKLPEFCRANLVFVSEEDVDKIEAFSKAYKLNNHPTIWWLKIAPEEVYNTFGNIGVPHVWVYDTAGVLVKEFKGETKPEALLEWL